jgi:arylsulfatase A
LEWPGGITQPRVVHTPVVTSDFFPTFIELAGGEMPARPFDGVSLVPLLRNEAGQFDREICFATRGWLAIQNEKHKLVRPKGEESSFELYDMQNDPYETRNIAASNSEIHQSLRRKLGVWVAECEASQLGHDYE